MNGWPIAFKWLVHIWEISSRRVGTAFPYIHSTERKVYPISFIGFLRLVGAYMGDVLTPTKTWLQIYALDEGGTGGP